MELGRGRRINCLEVRLGPSIELANLPDKTTSVRFLACPWRVTCAFEPGQEEEREASEDLPLAVQIWPALWSCKAKN